LYYQKLEKKENIYTQTFINELRQTVLNKEIGLIPFAAVNA